MIGKHGAEGAKKLSEKGLINFAEVVSHADAEKIN